MVVEIRAKAKTLHPDAPKPYKQGGKGMADQIWIQKGTARRAELVGPQEEVLSLAIVDAAIKNTEELANNGNTPAAEKALYKKAAAVLKSLRKDVRTYNKGYQRQLATVTGQPFQTFKTNKNNLVIKMCDPAVNGSVTTTTPLGKPLRADLVDPRGNDKNIGYIGETLKSLKARLNEQDVPRAEKAAIIKAIANLNKVWAFVVKANKGVQRQAVKLQGNQWNTYAQAKDRVVAEECGFQLMNLPKIDRVQLSRSVQNREVQVQNIKQGQEATITITGKAFPQDATVEFLVGADNHVDNGITVINGERVNDTTLRLRVRIAPNALADNPATQEVENPRSIRVVSHQYEKLQVVKPNAFTVLPAMTLTFEPKNAKPGQEVTATLSSNAPLPQDTRADLMLGNSTDPKMPISDPVRVNDTTIRFKVKVATDAPVGARTLRVSSSEFTEDLANAIQVTKPADDDKAYRLWHERLKAAAAVFGGGGNTASVRLERRELTPATKAPNFGVELKLGDKDNEMTVFGRKDPVFGSANLNKRIELLGNLRLGYWGNYVDGNTSVVNFDLGAKLRLHAASAFFVDLYGKGGVDYQQFPNHISNRWYFNGTRIRETVGVYGQINLPKFPISFGPFLEGNFEQTLFALETYNIANGFPFTGYYQDLTLGGRLQIRMSEFWKKDWVPDVTFEARGIPTSHRGEPSYAGFGTPSLNWEGVSGWGVDGRIHIPKPIDLNLSAGYIVYNQSGRNPVIEVHASASVTHEKYGRVSLGLLHRENDTLYYGGRRSCYNVTVTPFNYGVSGRYEACNIDKDWQHQFLLIWDPLQTFIRGSKKTRSQVEPPSTPAPAPTADDPVGDSIRGS